MDQRAQQRELPSGTDSCGHNPDYCQKTMALAIAGSEYNLKRTGTSVTVPDHPKARLMYYLNCICTALELDTSDDELLHDLRRYNQYYSLTEEESMQLLVLCLMISPDVLINKVIFHSDALCGDSANEFYELSQVRNMLVASSSIVIGGMTRRVKKIMTFKMSWLERNYLEPMKELADEIKEAQERERQRRRKKCIIQ